MIVTCVLVLFPALSSTSIVILCGCTSVPSGKLGTFVTPVLNLIVLVASSYTKKSGRPVTVVVLTPLPPALSSLVTAMFGSCPSTAIKSQFCPFVGAWIIGLVTSLTFNGIVTSFVVPSLKVTVASIFVSPYAAVLTCAFGTTVEIFSVPLAFPTFDVAVTLAFRSSFVTGVFWFTSINEAVTSYSELNSFTVTFTVTVSFEPSLYVTSTTPSFSPGVVVTGVVFQA